MTTLPSLPHEDEFHRIQVMAKSAATAGLFGTKNEAQIFAIMLMARELGIPVMQAINGGIWAIPTTKKDGSTDFRIELSARTMGHLIRKRGHQLKVKFLDNDLCRIWGKRADTGEEMEVPFTMEDARLAGLVKDWSAWKKVPQDMLFARCVSRIARRLFPDAIGECYVEGEIREMALKESLEKIEPMEEAEIEVESDYELPMQAGEDPAVIKAYLEEISKTHKLNLKELCERVSNNPDGFWARFTEWKDRQSDAA